MLGMYGIHAEVSLNSNSVWGTFFSENGSSILLEISEEQSINLSEDYVFSVGCLVKDALKDEAFKHLSSPTFTKYQENIRSLSFGNKQVSIKDLNDALTNYGLYVEREDEYDDDDRGWMYSYVIAEKSFK